MDLSFSSAPLEQLTWDKLEEAVLSVRIPRLPRQIRVSECYLERLKELVKAVEGTKEAPNVNLYGLPVRGDDTVVWGKAEVWYSDGSCQIIQLEALKTPPAEPPTDK